jgi:hypothetical protein
VHIINRQLRGEITAKEANSIGYNLFQLAKLRGSSRVEERLGALEQVQKMRLRETPLRDPFDDEDGSDTDE